MACGMRALVEIFSDVPDRSTLMVRPLCPDLFSCLRSGGGVLERASRKSCLTKKPYQQVWHVALVEE